MICYLSGNIAGWHGIFKKIRGEIRHVKIRSICIGTDIACLRVR